MKTMSKVMGIIFAVGMFVTASLENFLNGSDNIYVVLGDYGKLFLWTFFIIACLALTLTVVSVSIANKPLLIIAAVFLGLVVIFELTYLFNYYYDSARISHGYYLITSSALSICSFAFVIVLVSGKSSNKSNKTVNVENNANEDAVNPIYNVQNPADNMMLKSVGSANDTNTISERERILQLKNELNGLDFSKIAEQDTAGTLDATLENIENASNLKEELEREERELALLEAQRQQLISEQSRVQKVAKPVAPVVPSGPVDPYKETIIPRHKRGKIDPNKFKNPIGNTAAKISSPRPKRDTVKEVKLEEYKDKVFLGDSDRIWNAMKNQDRSLLQKQKNLARQIEREERRNNGQNTSTVSAKTKTVENSRKTVNLSDVTDIFSKKTTRTVKNNTVTTEVPTIDWDDE